MSALLGAFALLALSACGGGNATAANGQVAVSTTATPNCGTPGATANFASARGKVQSVSGNTATIATTSGSTVQVQFSAQTRYTKMQTMPFSALADGAGVQVLLAAGNANPLSAQTVLVRAAGTPGAGAGGPGSGFAGGAGFGSGSGFAGRRNPCRAANGQPAGGFAGFTASGRGVRGTIVQVDSTHQTITVEDATGTDYLVAVGGSTTISSMVAGSQSDVTPGATVNVTGTKTASGIDARIVTVGAALPGATTGA